MNGIWELAEVLQMRRGAVDAPLMKKLRLHVVDTVAAWIAATQTVEGKALLALRNGMRANRQGAARHLEDDLATHCALVRLSEIDDIHLRSMTTPGSIAVPAALTLAAGLPNVDSVDVAPAMLAGYEAMIRLGLAIDGPKALYRGLWPTYFGAGFAAAAVAACLLRLSQTQTAHALALALTTASPSVGQHHAATTARWFSVGNAARNGLTAALAAQSGFTADLDILRSRLFPELYGITPDIAVLAEDGAFLFSEVSIKPWCAARQTMAATQGLRQIMKADVRPDDITAITAYVLPPHLKMIDHGITPGDRASFLTSLPYQLALAALQPDRLTGLDLAAEIPFSSLRAFMARVKVVADDALLANYPASWPARLVVEAASGRRELHINCILGDPERSFTEEDVEKKFGHFAGPVLADSTSKSVQAHLTSFPSTGSISSLMADLDNIMATITE